ncbi:MAG: LPS export ABC transporter periplasmic protein LptC [Pseudomonadota bacterium]
MNTYGSLEDEADTADVRAHWQPERFAPRIGGKFDKTIWLLRIVLPLIGIALLVLTIAYPFLSERESSFVLARDSVETSQERLRMVNPRYSGLDAQERPFQIRAENAMQPRGVADEVQLNGIEADMVIEDTTAVSIIAGDGVYQPTDEKLQLVGPVTITTSNGYTIDAADSTVLLTERAVTSDKRLVANGPLGQFKAKRFEARIDEDRLIFRGGVKAYIDPRQEAASMRDTMLAGEAPSSGQKLMTEQPAADAPAETRQ